MTDVATAIEKLKGAAADFDTMGETLLTASRKADSIDLGLAQVGFMAVDEGFLVSYKGAQDFLIDVLADGAEAMHSVGKAVRKAANAYEKDEEAGAHRLGACDDALEG